MNDMILLKLGELVLKGLNRHNFEEQLMSNARRRLPWHLCSPPIMRKQDYR